jgi:L-rhamnose mutarotase
MRATRRYGMAVRLRPERADEYRQLHAAPWPEVVAELRRRQISNYSIYLIGDLLFSYFEYAGHDLQADLERSKENPVVAEWEKLCDGCFLPLESAGGIAGWVLMDEIFHLD